MNKSTGDGRARRWIKRSIEIVVFFTVFFLATSLLPSRLSWCQAGDWRWFFQPAARRLWEPYSVQGIYNPPWLFPILAPLAWLPTRVGAAMLAALTLTVLIGYVGGDWFKIMALILSAPVLSTVGGGQVDILPLLGLIGPTWCSLAVVAMKPQGVYLATLRRLNRTSVACLLTVLAASFLIWGFWPSQVLGIPPGEHNRSLFPWSLPVAAGILMWLRANPDSRYADALLCLASLAACPYWAIHSALPVVAIAVKSTESRVGCAAICAATWGYVFLTQA